MVQGDSCSAYTPLPLRSAIARCAEASVSRPPSVHFFSLRETSKPIFLAKRDQELEPAPVACSPRAATTVQFFEHRTPKDRALHATYHLGRAFTGYAPPPSVSGSSEKRETFVGERKKNETLFGRAHIFKCKCAKQRRPNSSWLLPRCTATHAGTRNGTVWTRLNG